jgi:hypothetical protein
MKKITFNLNKFQKTAYYEDAQGLMQSKSRAWMNCYKAKLDAKMSAQEAMEGCMEEFQDSEKNDWAFKYAKKEKK